MFDDQQIRSYRTDPVAVEQAIPGKQFWSVVLVICAIFIVIGYVLLLCAGEVDPALLLIFLLLSIPATVFLIVSIVKVSTRSAKQGRMSRCTLTLYADKITGIGFPNGKNPATSFSLDYSEIRHVTRVSHLPGTIRIHSDRSDILCYCLKDVRDAISVIEKRLPEKGSDSSEGKAPASRTSPVSDQAETRCKSCRGILAPDAKFCHHCGRSTDEDAKQKQPDSEPVLGTYCGFCGKELRGNAVFCPFCGKRQVGTQDVQIEYVPRDPQPETHHCSSCGAVIPDGRQFCGYCGTRFVAPQTVELPKCVACGTPLPVSASFCPECGLKYVLKSDGPIRLPSLPNCPNCQAELREGVTFCEQCGSQLPEALLSTHPIRTVSPCCPICGCPVDPSMPFCTHCGSEWKETGKPVKPIHFAGTLTCPVCWTSNLPADSKRCSHCGARFQI